MFYDWASFVLNLESCARAAFPDCIFFACVLLMFILDLHHGRFISFKFHTGRLQPSYTSVALKTSELMDKEGG
jgi:hypothetical protein